MSYSIKCNSLYIFILLIISSILFSENLEEFESFESCHILIYSNASDEEFDRTHFEDLRDRLVALGNTVDLEDRSTVPDIATILPGEYSQLWIINGKNLHYRVFDFLERRSIIDFAEMGRGLAILADDNLHFVADANFVSGAWSVTFTDSRDHSVTGSVPTECNPDIEFLHEDIGHGLTNVLSSRTESRLQVPWGVRGFEPVGIVENRGTGRFDTLAAVIETDILRIYFDCSFTRYLDGFWDTCSQDSILWRQISCWLEPGGCGCPEDSLPDEITLETFVETDCDDENFIEICYGFRYRTAGVDFQISTDNGTSWIPIGSTGFSTIDDPASAIGDSITPGEYCITWDCGADMPETEIDSLIILMEIYDGEYFTFYDTNYVILDTRAPRLYIACPDTMLQQGEPYTFRVEIEDSNMIFPTSIEVFGCGIDASFTNYSPDFPWVPTDVCESCTLVITVQDSFCNWSADTCVFAISEPPEPEPLPEIDSVWFWEDTDCDEQNIVTICYNLLYDTTATSVRVSPDSGTTWIMRNTEWFNTFSDTLGNIGNDVIPGVHCFDWHMNIDMPDTHGMSWIFEIMYTQTVGSLDSFVTLDTSIYNINGNDGFVDPDSGYLVLTQNMPWRNGRLMTVDSIYCDSVHISFNCKMARTFSSGADGVALIFSKYPDPPLAYGGRLGVIGTDGWSVALDTWPNCADIDGNHLELSIDSTECIGGSEPIPHSPRQIHIPFEIIDGLWHNVIIDVYYPRITISLDGITYINDEFPEIEPFWAYVGFSASTGSAYSHHIIDNFAIFSPRVTYFHESTAAIGPLDSRTPSIEFMTYDSLLIGGDSTLIDFEISDLFLIPQEYQVEVDYGSISDTLYISDSPFEFVPRPSISELLTVSISARDSFCNINSNSMELPIYSFDYSAEPILPQNGDVTACADQNITILITNPEDFDPDNLILHVNGSEFSSDDDEISFRSDTLIYTPSSLYNHNDEINVVLYQIHPLDDERRIILLDYNFRVDIESPISDMISPVNGEVLPNSQPNIEININDDLSGIFSDSIVISVNSNDFNQNSSNINFNFSDDSLSLRILFDITESGILLAGGDSIWVELSYIADKPDVCERNTGYGRWFFIIENSICNMFPNPFSPNLDDFNDFVYFWYPEHSSKTGILRVFSTNHEEVFYKELTPEVGDYNRVRSWDGKDLDGNPLRPGLYLYIITVDGKKVCEGTITLVR